MAVIALIVGIFGGLAPMFTEYLLSRQHIIMAPAIVIIGGAMVSWLPLRFDQIWRRSQEFLPEEAVLKG